MINPVDASDAKIPPFLFTSSSSVLPHSSYKTFFFIQAWDLNTFQIQNTTTKKAHKQNQKKRARSSEHRLGLTGVICCQNEANPTPLSISVNQFSLLASSTRLYACAHTARLIPYTNHTLLLYQPSLSEFIFNKTILIIKTHTRARACAHTHVYKINIFGSFCLNFSTLIQQQTSIFGH